MIYSPLFDLLDTVFDSSQCRDCVAGIHENDRWFTTPSFNQTAEYCRGRMLEANLDEVEMLPL